MAIALQGCVIIESKKGTIKYKKKCESCGYVENGTSSTSPMKSKHRVGIFKCPKCGNKQDIFMQGE